MATVGRGADQYTVRFPDGLRDRIKAAAEANNRSMNAEIVATLEREYPEPNADLEQAFMDFMTALRNENPHNEMLAVATARLKEAMRGVDTSTANSVAFAAASELLKVPPPKR